MKIATFNVNNINKRLPTILRWLKQSKPNVACLQELKCKTDDFPEGELRKLGYHAVWEGQKSWNGVAIPSKRSRPVITRRQLPGDKSDNQARYIEARSTVCLSPAFTCPMGIHNPGPSLITR